MYLCIFDFLFTCLHKILLNSSFIAYARAVLPRSPYVDVNLFLISSKKEKATLLQIYMCVCGSH